MPNLQTTNQYWKCICVCEGSGLSSLVGHYLNNVLDNFLLSGGQMKSEKFG